MSMGYKNVSNSIRTCVSQQALADVAILRVDTGGVVLTGMRRTLVDVNLAVVTLETRHTETVVLRHAVHADGPVLARVRETLVNVLLAVIPVESHSAAAFVAVRQTGASPVVFTGLVRTVHHA